MKSFFVALIGFLLGLWAVPAHAQGESPLSADSLTESRAGRVLKDWKFHSGDDPAWAFPHTADADWPQVSSLLKMPDAETKSNFKGIGWFRFHFTVDSTLVNIPLAYTLTQQGASVVYLDGKVLDSFGHIGNAQTSFYYDPDKPEAFILTTPGPHLLAVRYANYAAGDAWQRYAVEEAGFEMRVGKAETVFASDRFTRIFGAGFLMLLLGLFLALALLHILLFFYNRRNRSHLLFALFSLCMGLTGVCAYAFGATNDPTFMNKWGKLGVLVPFGAFFFLSAFLNNVFPSRRRWSFWLIAGTCGLTTIVILFFPIDPTPFIVVVIGLVALEATWLTIRAMVRRVPGARILGAGFLFFAAFILSIFVLAGLGITNIQLKSSENPGKAVLLVTLLVLVILCIPLSISAFLAWSVARTNKDLKLRLDEVAELSETTRRQEAEKQRLLQSRQEELETEVALRTEDLRRQKKRSDDLLLNILPAEVAEELKEKGTAEARQFANVSVLFTDFEGFTQVSEQLSPRVLVEELHTCFTAFDAIMEKHGLEKIKTIGDAYLAVCGLPQPDPLHAQKAVRAALDILRFMQNRARHEQVFNIRIGIHSGPVVAGIVGVKKFAYDIWGDTVNTAARMESSGVPGQINISAATYELIKDDFPCTARGAVEAKGKGEMEMYFIDTPVPAAQPSVLSP